MCVPIKRFTFFLLTGAPNLHNNARDITYSEHLKCKLRQILSIHLLRPWGEHAQRNAEQHIHNSEHKTHFQSNIPQAFLCLHTH